MNAERLLQHFEQISEAPDAIARLRRFILDLAVRGKLVEQDPEDEPAEELLRLITMEKVLNSRNARTARGIHVEVPALVDSPFDLPASWKWIPATYPASSISDPDKKVQTKEVLEAGAYPVVDQGKAFIRGYCNDPTKVIEVEEPLILFGDHTRETKFIDFDFVVGADGVKLLKPIGVYPKYFFLALRWLPLDSRGYGRHFKLLKSSVIPLPPLAEQHRIVAKVDELMALCDQLEAARKQREQTRERLVAASLQRLNQPAEDPASFRQHAQFALQTLPSLTTTPAQIKQLRQTILNLAVRGKLVEQDPEDEPVEFLLAEINSRMRSFGFKKVSSKPDPSGEPFCLPEGWTWRRLGEICEKTGSGSTPRGGKDAYANAGVPFLRSQNIYNDGLRLSDVVFIDEVTHGRMAGTRVLPADLLLNITGGSIGRCAKVPFDFDEANVSQHVAIIRVAARGMEDFIHALILSPYFQGFVDKSQTGAGRGGLPKNRMDAIPVPLPPLAEQHRIVAKVDELMALCDQLEQQLSQADQKRRRLLEAVLAEALREPEEALASERNCEQGLTV